MAIPRTAMFMVVLFLGIAFESSPGGWLARADEPDARNWSTELSRGLQSLHQRKFDTARESFQQALEGAQDKSAQGTILFYTGLSYQLEAEAADDVPTDRQKELLAQSRDRYEEAVKLLPNSGGLWNNLGLVQGRLGAKSQAGRAFLQAIQTKSSDQAAYLVNYADLLASLERFDDANRFYHVALSQNPFHPKARAALDRYYLHHARSRLGDFVWSLFYDGRSDWSLELALAALEDKPLEEPGYERLLTVAVRSLSTQRYEPKAFAASELGLRFRHLSEHAVLREPIGEVMSLHDGNTDPERYSWWKTRVDLEPGSYAPRGGWPQEAFTQLSRSLGRWHEQHEALERAEAYYRLAYELTPNHLDPEAIIDLANLWVGHERPEDLQAFMDREERRIFVEKGTAIRVRRYERTYEMHRALAIVYMHLGRWESDAPFRNARQQIEMALTAADRFNRIAQGDGRNERIAEWHLAQDLADWYQATDQNSRAFAVRVEHARRLQAADCLEAAAQLFQPIAAAAVPAVMNNRDIARWYDELRTAYEAGEMRPSGLDRPDGESRIRRTFIPKLGTDINVAWPNVEGFDPANIDRAWGEVRRLLDTDRQGGVRMASDIGIASPVDLIPESAPTDLLKAEFDGRRGSLEFSLRPGTSVIVPFEIPEDKPALQTAPRKAVRP